MIRQQNKETYGHTYIHAGNWDDGWSDGDGRAGGRVIQTMGPVEEWKKQPPDIHTYMDGHIGIGNE
jgi:hypothetical protein